MDKYLVLTPGPNTVVPPLGIVGVRTLAVCVRDRGLLPARVVSLPVLGVIPVPYDSGSCAPTSTSRSKAILCSPAR